MEVCIREHAEGQFAVGVLYMDTFWVWDVFPKLYQAIAEARMLRKLWKCT